MSLFYHRSSFYRNSFAGSQRIQNLVDNAAPKAELYFSDAFLVYLQICYEGVYRALKNKFQTFTVESVNVVLRHYIPPLYRKSRCFSRFF